MSDVIPALPEAAKEALARGDSIEAIRRYRECHGVGLREAKDAVDRHLQGLPPTHQPHQRMASPAGPVHRLPDAVLDAMRAGHKLEAIRLLRAQTGLGLKEAKEAVEQASAANKGKNIPSKPQTKRRALAPGEERPASSAKLAWLLVALLLMAVASYAWRHH